MGGDTEEARIDMAQKLQSTFGIWSKSINHLDFPQQFNHHPSQIHSHKEQISPNSNKESGKRPPSHPQFPPISPYSHNGTANQQLHSQNYNNPGPTHSRSLSQPSFFSLDSLPPLPYKDSPSNDVSMDDRTGYSHSLLPPSGAENTNSLPSRKVHRRSNSDIPFGFSSMLNSSPPVIPFRRVDSLDHKSGAMPIQLVRQDSSEGETVDDLFNACMNMDSFDSLNSSDNHEDFGSRASGTKTTDSSDNEATSSVNQTVNNLQLPGNKRNAWGGDIAPTTTRHYRSISVDSFMEKINFDDESVKLPPSPGICPGQLSPSNSLDKDSGFSLEFGNGEFSGAELKKIMANDKLSEIASADPKRAKRILANRQSAARSKERKMRYIAELEHKVQTLQTEATTLSAQLTLLQRDSVGLSSQNNELKYRVQAIGQQAQLRDALNEALTAEVQRLKITAAEMSGEDASQFQKLSLDRHMYLQNGNTSTKQEMNH